MATEWEYVRSRLDELADGQAEQKAMLKNIGGNGQPGRLGVVEIKIGRVEAKLNRMGGQLAALAALAAVIGDVLLRLWH